MKRELVPDSLWERVQPLLPRHRPHRKGGRPYADDRAALRGILFVLKTGISWEDLPAEVFGVSGVTCWRRLHAWARARVFARLQRRLLDELGLRGDIDWSRAAFDSARVAAKKGGPRQARAPRTEGRRAASTTSS
jgi:transposase